ncbi:MAG: exopolysaccharide Pel transporter PelG [Lachnospiraceae bacterium]|nr:exopolysaccharide Pel transporter PelG [Lachnospiraceae bacterium]
MAGIGVKLNKIYSKNTITTSLVGFGYSTVITIAPMILIIGAIVLMQLILGYSKLDYINRDLYACTVLYIFIFGLTACSPFNAVLSRYLSDVIYEEHYDDILPCYYVGLLLNISLGVLLSVPFCIHELVVGKVDFIFVIAGFFGYMALILAFYSMLFLSICKDYGKISLYFLFGMVLTVLLSLILVKIFGMDVSLGMLISLDAGFALTATLEMALVRSYFRENSGNYRSVFHYFRKFWMLILTNFFYTLGLYVHNFVFWTTDLRVVVADTFVNAPPYDMATCLAMFTNISAVVIFISRMEMNFHERYKRYYEAVIGGRGMDITNAKNRLFEQLKHEIMNLVRLQFIITVIVFLVFIVFLPMFGFGGLVLQIYPCLAAGYFIMFLLYGLIVFLYYFNDLRGALATAMSFCLSTFLISILASLLPAIWYGLGLVIGSFIGFTVAYFRLRSIERNLDVHVFCNGTLLDRGPGRKRPSNIVYNRDSLFDGVNSEGEK